MIIQLNERALFAMGFDKPAVEALRHFLRMVGDQLGAQTLPDAFQRLHDAELAPQAQQIAQQSDPLTPAYCAPIQQGDLTPVAQQAIQVEFLQTEVRQMAEQIAVLQQQINDLNQGTP